MTASSRQLRLCRPAENAIFKNCNFSQVRLVDILDRCHFTPRPLVGQFCPLREFWCACGPLKGSEHALSQLVDSVAVHTVSANTGAVIDSTPTPSIPRPL